MILRVNEWDKYYITDEGSLFRRDGRNKGLCRVGYTDKFGYISAVLRDNGRKKNIRIHTLVWNAFRSEIPKGYVIDHINNVRADNRLVNLQKITIAENVSKGKTHVFYREDKKRWIAKIQIDYKCKTKHFMTKPEAIKQYQDWKIEAGRIL